MLVVWMSCTLRYLLRNSRKREKWLKIARSQKSLRGVSVCWRGALRLLEEVVFGFLAVDEEFGQVADVFDALLDLRLREVVQVFYEV